MESSLLETRRRATKSYLPYGIAQCQHRWTRPASTPSRQMDTLDSPTPEGWRAELTMVEANIPKLLTNSHPSTRQQPDWDDKYNILTITPENHH